MSMVRSGVCLSCTSGERSAPRTHWCVSVLIRKKGLLFIMELSPAGAALDTLPHDACCILNPILCLLQGIPLPIRIH